MAKIGEENCQNWRGKLFNHNCSLTEEEKLRGGKNIMSTITGDMFDSSLIRPSSKRKRI